MRDLHRNDANGRPRGALSVAFRRKVALTFPEAAKEYLAKLEEIGGKGIERKKCQLDLHLKPFFRQKALSKITSFDLERYKKHRIDEGASCATVNRELAVLSHLFNMGVEWKMAHASARQNQSLQRGQWPDHLSDC